jgi:hypothetical protein
MADAVYLVEYAKSGRSKCADTKCKQMIPAQELRIGRKTANPFHSGGKLAVGDGVVYVLHPDSVKHGCRFSVMTLSLSVCLPAIPDNAGALDMLKWYHAGCMFSAQSRMRAGSKKISATSDLEGFADLKKEDQEQIRSYITNGPPPTSGGAAGDGGKKRAAGKGAASGKKKPKKKKAKKDRDDDDEEEEDVADDGSD